MTWSSINDLATSFLKKKGIEEKVQESLVLEQANELILDFFGEEFKNKFRAVYFNQGTLTIAVLSDEFYRRLKDQEKELITSLNNKFSVDIVSTLKFLV